MTISASGSHKLESRCNLQTALLTLLGLACVCSVSFCTVDLITFLSRPEQLCGVTLSMAVTSVLHTQARLQRVLCWLCAGQHKRWLPWTSLFKSDGDKGGLFLNAYCSLRWGEAPDCFHTDFGLHYTDCCCGGWTLMWLLSECSLLGQNQELAGFSAAATAATLCMHAEHCSVLERRISRGTSLSSG